MKISKFYGISPYKVFTWQKPDIVAADKAKKATMIIDVALPGDTVQSMIKNKKRSRNTGC